MLIKLTKIGITSSGHGPNRKVDRIIKDPIWINPSHIITLSLKSGPESCPDLTEIVIGKDPEWTVFTVLETPEQINNLISGYSKGGFA